MAARSRFVAPGITLAVSLSALTAQAPSTSVPDGAPAGIRHVDREDLKAHASFLASDELGGRYTGTEGQEMAAEYISEHFERLGLEPLGDKKRGGRSYFQSYPLERTYLDPKATAITIGKAKSQGGFAVVTGSKASKLKLSGSFAYCGDGSPDEIPKQSLKRRLPVVVLFEDEGEGAGGGGERGNRGGEGAGRRGQGGRRRGGGRGFTMLNRIVSVQRELESRGARVVLFCLVSEDSRVGDLLNVGGLMPGKPMLSFGSSAARNFFSRVTMPSVFVGRPLALQLLSAMGVDPDQGAVDGGATTAKGRVEFSVKVDKKFSARNVVAYLPGSHKKLAKEAVIYSAHMDHMGTRVDGDAFNGADDNASGSSALLDIAQAFAKEGAPKRSVIFLAVSGEELGLWGSEYYSDNPTWPLPRLVANINIDMIGRATELSGVDEISVTPSHSHPEYSTLVRSSLGIARKLGIGFTNGDRYYRRSDHYNFARKGVPVVFYCDGEHEDYHKVTDHADKLDYGKMEGVARLAYWTGWEAAEADGRPQTLGDQTDW